MRRYNKHRQNFSRRYEERNPVYYNESDIYEDEFVREDSRPSNRHNGDDYYPRGNHSFYREDDHDDYNSYELDYDPYPGEDDYAYANRHGRRNHEQYYNRPEGSFNSTNRNSYRDYDRGMQEFRNEQRRLYNQQRRSRRY